ncbi:MAG TPA: S-4TM family putative pore-forming effector [candidate division Zixibacteria bacterium]|nr:S-4TM family putative pore-forming effector [candidate division Zixibacteria bacterium]
MSELLNTIPKMQNEPRQLERLAAQKQLYSIAKVVKAIQIIITVPVTIGIAIAVAFKPELSVWGATYGIVVSILNAAYLDTAMGSYKNKAADIQQAFDCDVLQLSWSKLKLNKTPEPELISAAANKYKKKDPDFNELRNWYPEKAGEVPIRVARIICQRSNAWYDASLRKTYANYVGSLVGAVVATILLLGIYEDKGMQHMVLAVFTPLMPVILWGIKEYRSNLSAIHSVKSIFRDVDALFKDAIGKRYTDECIENRSSHLQAMLYDYRRNTPVIFDWVHKLLKNKQEAQMIAGAEILVEKTLERMNEERNP